MKEAYAYVNVNAYAHFVFFSNILEFWSWLNFPMLYACIINGEVKL